jgi:hypothetical protein
MTESQEQTVVFYDVPDPLIGEFIDRVLALGPDRWQSLGLDSRPLWRFALRLWPRRIKIILMHRMYCAAIISSSTIACGDPKSLHYYKQMFKSLKRLGWPIEARSVVAESLFALRARDNLMARPYSAGIEKLIPLESLNHTRSVVN